MTVFSCDAETDGLYGPVWAIGAVVLPDAPVDEPGRSCPVFSGMIDPTEAVTDQWVKDNIVPLLWVEGKAQLPLYPSREALLNAFWAFWIEHREGTTAVANFGVPVESGLFRACVELDLAGRQWQGPFPLHELGTIQLALGLDPTKVDSFDLCGIPKLVRHNPLDDSIAAGMCFQIHKEALGYRDGEDEPDDWCVHVIGPDDVMPMPNEATALLEANALNVAMADREITVNTPHIIAVAKRAKEVWGDEKEFDDAEATPVVAG